jgi:hypothetical protein
MQRQTQSANRRAVRGPHRRALVGLWGDCGGWVCRAGRRRQDDEASPAPAGEDSSMTSSPYFDTLDDELQVPAAAQRP